MPRAMNQLTNYRDGLFEALKNAAGRGDLGGTPSGSGNLDEDAIRKLAQCGYGDIYRKDTDGQDNGIDNQEDDDEGEQLQLQPQPQPQPPCGTIRIRNLEDIIRQLEHHTR